MGFFGAVESSSLPELKKKQKLDMEINHELSK